MTVIGPDGSTIYPQNYAFNSGPMDLNESGVYQLKVLGVVGYATNVQISSVPPDVTATASIDGGPVTLAFTAAAQSGLITFQGTAGQKVNIALNGGSCNFTLLDPAMTAQYQGQCTYAGPGLIGQVLRTTGTYTLKVQQHYCDNKQRPCRFHGDTIDRRNPVYGPNTRFRSK